MRVHSPAGFTLIEVLVALFVLTAGLLGAATMQAKARALHTDAIQRSSALQIATSLAERMRANPVAMSVSDASNPYLHIDIDSGARLGSATQCFGHANCTPTDLAAFDAFESARALHDAFPRARLRVCRDAGASAALAWDCDATTGASVVIKLGWPTTKANGFAPSFALPVSGGGT